MKKTILYLLILITSTSLLSNCEKENLSDLTILETKKSLFKFKTISLSEIPEIRNFLVTKTNLKLSKSTEIDGAIFDEDNILEIIDTLDQANYTFRFSYPDTPIGTFYNLIAGKTSGGENKIPYVLKYVCDQTNLDEYITNNFDYRFFKGQISIHKYTDFFQQGSFTKSGNPICPPNTDSNGDPIPCDTIGIDGNPNGSSGGGDGEGGNGNPSGSGTSYNSAYSSSGTVYSSGWYSSNGDGGSGASPCVWVEYITYDEEGNFHSVVGGYECPDDKSLSLSTKVGDEDCPECGGPSGPIGVLPNTLCSNGAIEDEDGVCTTWTASTVLFTNISDPIITNIVDYLKCFNLTQSATLTIYADQPTANSSTAWSMTITGPDVGHTFLSISQNGITRTLGYYPLAGTIRPISAPGFPAVISSPSLIRNNENHAYDVSASTTITASQLSNLINNITNYNSTYNLNSNNCTDFGISLANGVGMGVADTSGNWPGNGNGSNPGNLGQDIRALNNNTNGIQINNSGGNAPSNSGTCN